MRIRNGIYLIISCIFFSCAQIVNPSGGNKDKNPPKPLVYAPDSAALNFKSKQIRILFDEYIQLKDLNSQLIISPPMKHQPDIKVKNKSLVVDINDTLNPNTTYAFNFGSSIADITESNSIENFQYVFSTGPFIDSLVLTGTVKDAFTLAPEKGILVMMYDTFDDSVPYKKLPNYFAKTKEDGTYRINNIREGKYKVFALKDGNANYLYDDQEEKIAFSDSLITLQKNQQLNLFLFKEIPSKQFIKKATAIEFGHLQIVFNRPIDKPNLQPLNFIANNNSWKIEQWGKANDTLNLWLPGFEKDSIRFVISDDTKIIDTLEMAIPSKTKGGRGKGDVFHLAYTTNVNGGLFDLHKAVHLQFNHPIKTETIKSTILILEDSIPMDTASLMVGVLNDGWTIISPVKYDLSRKQIAGIEQPWKENTGYAIRIMKNAITDIFGLKNDTIKLNFKTYENNYYGMLKLKLRLPPSKNDYLLNIYDDKGSVVLNNVPVNNNRMPDVIEFKPWLPGSYKMRLIYNLTNPEKWEWDTGNYLKHLQPEKVIYYPGTITIRSNWDLEQEWKVRE